MNVKLSGLLVAGIAVLSFVFPAEAVDRVFNVPPPTGNAISDTANIQNTFDAAATVFNTSDASGRSGIAVIFSNGTYQINSRVEMIVTNIPSKGGGIMIRGAGVGTGRTFIQSTNSNPTLPKGALYVQTGTTGSNPLYVQIEDLVFSAKSPDAGPAIEILPVNGGDGLASVTPVLRNIMITRVAPLSNGYTYGIKACKVNRSIFDNINIESSLNNCVAGIALSNHYGFNMKDSSIKGAETGISSTYFGEGNMIQRTTITNVNVGVYMGLYGGYMSNSDGKILNSSISAKQCGALIANRSKFFVSNNEFLSEAGSAAYNDLEFEDGSYIIIAGNRFTGAGTSRTGIYLGENVHKTMISDNTFGTFNVGINVKTNVVETMIFNNSFGMANTLVDSGIGTTFTLGTPDPFVSPAAAKDSESFSWGQIKGTVYNVKNFGAQGDGSTDDTGKIRDAVAAAVANLNAGLTKKSALYFPAGTYIVKDLIDLIPNSNAGTNLTIYGDGMGASVIKRDTGGTAGLFNIQVSAGTRVDIHNMMLAPGEKHQGAAVYMSHPSISAIRSLYMRNVSIRGFGSKVYFQPTVQGEKLFSPFLDTVIIDMNKNGDIPAGSTIIKMAGGKGFETEFSRSSGRMETGLDIASASPGTNILIKNTHGYAVGPQFGAKINAGGGLVAIEGSHINGNVSMSITNANGFSFVNTESLPGSGNSSDASNVALGSCTNATIRNNIFHASIWGYKKLPGKRTILLCGNANKDIDVYGNLFNEASSTYVYTPAGAPAPTVRFNRFQRTDVDDIAGPATISRLYDLNGQIDEYYLIRNKENGKYLAATGTGTVDVTCSGTNITDEVLWRVGYEENPACRYTLTNKKQGTMLKKNSADVDCSGTLTNANTRWFIDNRSDGYYTLKNDNTFLGGYAATDDADCSRTTVNNETQWQMIFADRLVEGMDKGSMIVTQLSSTAWTTVEFAQPFIYPPAVFMGGPSCNDTAPLTVRVKNITTTNFQFQLDEWDYLDGAHAEEEVGFVAAHKGHYMIRNRTIDSGSIIVGTNWVTHTFSTAFSSIPSVFAQCSSVNEGSAVCTRVRNVTTTNFQVRLQEKEVGGGTHANETVDFIAINPGGDTLFKVGLETAFLTDTEKTLSFGSVWKKSGIIGSIQSVYGNDPCALRYLADTLTTTNVQIKVDDDISDGDSSHANPENVGWMVFNYSDDEDEE
jgi:hypothetical protein